MKLIIKNKLINKIKVKLKYLIKNIKLSAISFNV